MRLPAASVTPAEFSGVCAQALAAEMSAAEFVRRCVLGRRIAPRQAQADGAAVVELIRVGNNLNQLARAANSGRPPAAAELRGALAELQAVLRRLTHRAECGEAAEFGGIDAQAQGSPPASEGGRGGGNAGGPAHGA